MSTPGNRANGSTDSFTQMWRGRHLFREPDLLQGHSHHDLGRDLRQRHADGLGDERHRAGRARVHLDDVQLLALHRVLHVHEPDHAELLRKQVGVAPDLFQHPVRQGVRREHHGRVPRMHARLLDVLHDAADHAGAAVRHHVHVHLDGVLDEPVDEHGPLRRRPDGALHVVRQAGSS